MERSTTGVDGIVQGVLRPSPGLIILVLAIVVTGKVSETALAIVLMMAVT